MDHQLSASAATSASTVAPVAQGGICLNSSATDDAMFSAKNGSANRM